MAQGSAQLLHMMVSFAAFPTADAAFWDREICLSAMLPSTPSKCRNHTNKSVHAHPVIYTGCAQQGSSKPPCAATWSSVQPREFLAVQGLVVQFAKHMF